MATKSIKELHEHLENLRQFKEGNTELPLESIKQRNARIQRARTDYQFFVEYYFPHYCTHGTTGELIPCADFHIETANRIKNNPDIREIEEWARGHAKSCHMDIFVPMWLKCQEKKQVHVMVLVSKSEDNAKNLLKAVQDELMYNQRYINDFGEQVKDGDWAEGKFVTCDDTAFFALGRSQSPRGLRHHNRRPDYIICDDLDDDELCSNESRVKKATEWTTEALFGCFGAEGGRFIVVGNLISRTSIIANLSKINGFAVNQVNVLNSKGEPSWPAYWKTEKIKENELIMGYRAFQKEFMNNPVTDGAVFKQHWIKYKKMLPLDQYAELIVYVDPSFKPTTKNDYKAAKFWGKTTTGELHHIDAFVRQTTIGELVTWMYDLYERTLKENATCLFYMEANFMQDMIVDEFQTEGNFRGYQLPLIPDKRKKPDKFQRVEAVSPFWERGLVWYNEELQNTPDFRNAIDQTLAFQKGMSGHDDAPDADEGALWILQKRTRAMAFSPMVENVHHVSSRFIY